MSYNRLTSCVARAVFALAAGSQGRRHDRAGRHISAAECELDGVMGAWHKQWANRFSSDRARCDAHSNGHAVWSATSVRCDVWTACDPSFTERERCRSLQQLHLRTPR